MAALELEFPSPGFLVTALEKRNDTQGSGRVREAGQEWGERFEFVSVETYVCEANGAGPWLRVPPIPHPQR